MSSKTIYDKHGNRIGEDVFSTDRDGRVQIRHYDSRNNLVGRSYETTDYKGDVYIIHEDASGRILSRSTMEKDWWGEYYIKTEPDKRNSKAISDKKASEESDSPEDYGLNAGESALYILSGVLIKLLKFIGFFLLIFFSFSWGIPILVYLLVPAVIATQSKILAFLAFPLLSLVQISYWPYAIINIYRRFKKKITWGDYFKNWGLWLIIGPFAYKKLLAKKQPEYNLGLPDPKELLQTKRYCPECGTPIDITKNFCYKCGAKINND